VTTPNVALVKHSLRQALSGRRLAGVAVLALVPAVLGLAFRQWGPSDADLEPLLFTVGTGLVVPLLALVIGVAALREDLREGTMVHLVTRPVSRESVLVTRMLGAALATFAIGALALTLALPAIGSLAFDAWWTAIQVTALAALAYTCLFALLGVLMNRAILVGLAYLVAWEGVVASTDLFFSKLTVAYWLRSIVAQQGLSSDNPVSEGVAGTGADPLTATIVLLGMAAGAAILGAIWFGRREFASPEPE
jgi:ABC-2 type transport system permease protein